MISAVHFLRLQAGSEDPLAKLPGLKNNAISILNSPFFIEFHFMQRILWLYESAT